MLGASKKKARTLLAISFISSLIVLVAFAWAIVALEHFNTAVTVILLLVAVMITIVNLAVFAELSDRAGISLFRKQPKFGKAPKGMKQRMEEEERKWLEQNGKAN